MSLSDELQRYDLLGHVGSPLADDTYRRVHSLDEVVGTPEWGRWGSVQLEAGNAIGLTVNRVNERLYARWNDIATPARVTVDAILDQCAGLRGLSDSVRFAVRCSVAWDLMHALIEEEYERSGVVLSFFRSLLPIYGAGHVPCGWAGEYPDGSLLVC